MNKIVEKERELSMYLEEWVSARYTDWDMFYHSTCQTRRTGIYLLKSGTELMDFLNDIMGNIEDHFSYDANCHIIPSRFSSIPQLMQFLENFKHHIKSHCYLLDKNIDGADTNAIVFEMYKMCNDIDQMVTRCQSIYQSDDNILMPYLQARNALRDHKLDQFVKSLYSLIKCVPYNIHKEKLDEGYFHSIIHIITSVLGLSPISEIETSDGRIDMMIEFPNLIYIMEFKYSGDNKDRSDEALKQIKDKEYAKAFFIKGKVIEGVGMSFSQKTHNIEYYKQDLLYTPSIDIYG